MLGCQTLETDWELDVARANDILNLEVRELSIEAKLLDDSSVFATGKLAVILRFGTGDDHLPGGENQGGSFRLTNAHDDSRESLRRLAKSLPRYKLQPASSTLGLYSALRACNAMVLRSKRQSRFTVATMFLAQISPRF
jgi:hypothetical protein